MERKLWLCLEIVARIFGGGGYAPAGERDVRVVAVVFGVRPDCVRVLIVGPRPGCPEHLMWMCALVQPDCQK